MSRMHVASTLSLAIAPLAALAAATGLVVPSVYRDPAWLVPQTRGPDLVTLIAMPRRINCPGRG